MSSDTQLYLLASGQLLHVRSRHALSTVHVVGFRVYVTCPHVNG